MARWLLLLCTVVGLTAMHTLGHAGMAGHDRHSPTADAPAVMAAAAAMVPSFTAADACAGDHCPAAPRPGGDMWSVCLAILTGLGVIVLLAVLWFISARRTAGAGDRRVRAGLPARSPPRSVAGSTLTATTVLRI